MYTAALILKKQILISLTLYTKKNRSNGDLFFHC